MSQYKQALNLQGTPVIVEIPSSTSSSENDINAAAASLYQTEVINNSDAAVYHKGWNSASPTVGTTDPILVLMVPADETLTFSSYPPIAFGTSISTATVLTGGTGGSGSPTSTVEVNYYID